MNDLPERLRALAKSLPWCYSVPSLSDETCLDAADALEAMQRDHDAMEVLRSGGVSRLLRVNDAEMTVVASTPWHFVASTPWKDGLRENVFADDPAEAILKAAGKE